HARRWRQGFVRPLLGNPRRTGIQDPPGKPEGQLRTQRRRQGPPGDQHYPALKTRRAPKPPRSREAAFYFHTACRLLAHAPNGDTHSPNNYTPENHYGRGSLG